MATGRDYTFTIQNPPRPYGPLNLGNVQYAIHQLERGDSGTLHYQGFVQFARESTLSAAKKKIGSNAHVEKRYAESTNKQASDYCKKPESHVMGPWIQGEISLGQGSRTDIVGFVNEVKNGKRERELIDLYPHILARYGSFYKRIRMNIRPVRTIPLVVCIYYGATGTGKTRLAEELMIGNEYWRMPVNNNNIWFDYMDGHKNILLDEFAGRTSRMTLAMLLQLLDIYVIRVPVKTSFTWWCPDNIIITTNVPVQDWYSWTGRGCQYQALKRRIHKVLHFTMTPESPVDVTETFFDDYLSY